MIDPLLDHPIALMHKIPFCLMSSTGLNQWPTLRVQAPHHRTTPLSYLEGFQSFWGLLSLVWTSWSSSAFVRCSYSSLCSELPHTGAAILKIKMQTKWKIFFTIMIRRYKVKYCFVKHSGVSHLTFELSRLRKSLKFSAPPPPPRFATISLVPDSNGH